MNAHEPDRLPDGPPEPSIPHLHWHRFPEAGWLTGVCAGVAHYTRVPVEIVRLAFFLGTLFGWGLIIYVALVILMPKRRAGAG